MYTYLLIPLILLRNYELLIHLNKKLSFAIHRNSYNYQF